MGEVEVGHRATIQARKILTVALRQLAGAKLRLNPPNSSVALTFDDGPDPVFTPLVLDVLSEQDAVATFFVVGRSAADRPALIQRILNEGHALGSHSFSHAEPGAMSVPELLEDYRAGRRAAEDAGGIEVNLFRPPQSFIGFGEMLAIRLASLDAWLWSRNPRDWEAGATTSSIVESAGGLMAGDVVLLHDGLANPKSPAALDRSSTVEALPHIVRIAHDTGLSFKTLPNAATQSLR